MDFTIKNMGEFGDGSDWTLSKCLTHANRTFNLMNNLIKSGEQVSKDIQPTLKRGERSLIVKGCNTALRGLKEISSR